MLDFFWGGGWGRFENLRLPARAGRTTKIAWDYVCSVLILHWVVVCIVSGVPATWQWWVTQVVLAPFLSLAAFFMCYKLRDLREIHVRRVVSASKLCMLTATNRSITNN